MTEMIVTMIARTFLSQNCGMEFSSIYWLSETHGKTEALLLSKYQIRLEDDDYYYVYQLSSYSTRVSGYVFFHSMISNIAKGTTDPRVEFGLPK